ncbi:sirohydrochlorin cobaltochelatase [Clostridium sp. B9]|uniref:sirohydrochlorin cobaltochelatase n=1 Tax=Clostridium sp. B9 TaxID=3423224 RepID=UPI003D2F3D5A
MKKAIVIMGVGTSDLELLNQSFGKVSDDLKKAFSQYDIYTSFTSKKIMDKLKKIERKSILNPVETLDYLKKKGYEKVIIQPLHIIQGDEYENLNRLKSQFRENFNELILTNALLCEDKGTIDRYDDFIKSISGKLNSNENIVLVGHGGTHKGNESYIKLQRELIEHGYKNVLVGTISGVPSFNEVLDKIKKNNWKKIKLIPLMFLAGHHSKLDICSLRNEMSWNSKLTKVGIEVECDSNGLVELEEFRKLYIESIKNIIMYN